MADSNATNAGRLAGRTALVTGASRGIGRAIALAYAREGARLALAATNEAALRDTAAACEALAAGCAPSVHVLDVARRDQCFATVADAAARHGAIDVLVNAAGIYRARSFLQYEERDFRDLLDVNLHGTVHLMQAVLPAMIERRAGRIVNIASTAGKWASMGQSAYNVSKHAVVGLTRCVAQEMGIHGICVNAICPGLVQTDMLTDNFGRTADASGKPLDEILAPVLTRVAMRRVMQPDELTGLAVYLASPESSGMTGQSLVIDGGMLYT
ncbi:MAG TPA: SDR family oxidoreductase [Burkholderiaceae bacterium]|nr:SDR family oxidoreductase [Burkholderiaceae bacterium]